MSQKGLAPILIVILIALALGGYFVYTTYYSNNRTKIAQPQPTTQPPPTSDPTVNWKTFQNGKLGYELKYPSDWSIHDEDGSGELFIMSKRDKVGFIEIQNELVFDLKPGQTVESWLKDTPGFGGEYKMLNINDEIAYLGEEGKAIEDSTQLYIKHKDKYLSIVLSGFKFEEVTQILSTFKFLP